MTLRTIQYLEQSATRDDIQSHLEFCDADYLPPLSSRVDIPSYAAKLHARACTFEAWQDRALVGLVAAYLNDTGERAGFITSVSVVPGLAGQGVAAALLKMCIDGAWNRGMRRLDLQVSRANLRAIGLYEKFGFTRFDGGTGDITMRLDDNRTGTMSSSDRDYNLEIRDTADHQYAYGFDFDVMHPYMLRAFEPFLRDGSALELGCFKGDFTRRLVERFDDVTCVEASDEAVATARQRIGNKAVFVNSRFENAVLPRKYDNIILTHVLEHIDDPVQVLKRVNDEWLADRGRFFLVCPNANAPSRQIAVKMGLISHNSAVTPAESEHGHRCTYTLDTLERDATLAGLKVVHRSGIFFKALANFQWDRLLQTDIISKEYLDGCYMLGQQYPDLCSSIFLMCEKG